MREVPELQYHLYPMAPPACKIRGVFNNVSFQSKHSPPKVNGGARRDRTDDLLNANQALFQLSYGPIKIHLSVAGIEFQRRTIPHIENTTDAVWMHRKPTPTIGWPVRPQRKAIAIIENQICAIVLFFILLDSSHRH